MAGMLPGVESARRRRCHGTGAAWADSQSSSFLENSKNSRRSSLCLYSSNNSSHSNLLQKRAVKYQQQQQEQEDDEKLGGAAREAKERLDERLRSQYRKLEPKRRNSTGRISSSVALEGRTTTREEVRNQEPSAGLRRSSSSSKRLMMSWAKLRSWKSSDQEECAVCLEHFKSSEDLSFLPCAHRFHSKCLLPWLQENAHCPCCRNPI
ncbi:uncharacterized protein LOC141713617 [Apium graveolens]|uniref:RING-type domain-containing protein n=1 Tax=Apium graveolens TaxID=4045 RepID=A0A6L5B7H3_APIGR|nr:hypothetical protein AG4045_028820 [Apium graveolens]